MLTTEARVADVIAQKVVDDIKAALDQHGDAPTGAANESTPAEAAGR